MDNALHHENCQAIWWELQNQKLTIINEKYAKGLYKYNIEYHVPCGFPSIEAISKNKSKTWSIVCLWV